VFVVCLHSRITNPNVGIFGDEGFPAIHSLCLNIVSRGKSTESDTLPGNGVSAHCPSATVKFQLATRGTTASFQIRIRSSEGSLGKTMESQWGRQLLWLFSTPGRSLGRCGRSLADGLWKNWVWMIWNCAKSDMVDRATLFLVVADNRLGAHYPTYRRQRFAALSCFCVDMGCYGV
jgi:hypothetical protein